MSTFLASTLITAIVLCGIYLFACRSMQGAPLRKLSILLRVVFGVACVFFSLRMFNVISFS